MRALKVGLIAAAGLCVSACALAFWPFDRPRPDSKPDAPAERVKARPLGGLTLSQAYGMALETSEDIVKRTAAIEQAQGHFYQALDVVMPSVHFLITRKEQDAPESSGSSDGVSSSSLRRSTPEKKFTFSQPLFSGFKEFAALQGSGAEKSQRRFEKQRAEQLLFIDVMEAFYACLSAEKDVETTRSTQKALSDRVTELKARVDIGRSRASEIETAGSELKVTEADLLDAQRTLAASRKLLSFYIGRELDRTLVDGADAAQDPAACLTYYLVSVPSRPDVKAAENALTLAEKNVVVAQAGLFPTISVDGNYYTQRVGFQSGIDWDATLKFDVPVFEGTQVIGDIKVAQSTRHDAEAELSRVRRQAELDVRDAFDNYDFAVRRRQALEAAAEAMRRNYELQKQDYQHSLVNNLEVLDALKRSEDITRQANAAVFDAKRDRWKLKIAAGETP